MSEASVVTMEIRSFTMWCGGTSLGMNWSAQATFADIQGIISQKSRAGNITYDTSALSPG
jgi:hypothetical protein